MSGRSRGADSDYEFKTDGETGEHDYSLGGGACESRSTISSDGAVIDFTELTRPLRKLYSELGRGGYPIEQGFRCLLLQFLENVEAGFLLAILPIIAILR